MARNFFRIFTENNPVIGDSKTFGIPEAKGLRRAIICAPRTRFRNTEECDHTCTA